MTCPRFLTFFGALVALNLSFLGSPAEAEHQSLGFAGRTWNIKHSTTPVGPGSNIFSESPSDVWSDAAGLHLTIQKTGPTWFSTEVVLNENLGYGTYMFQTDSRQDILDAKAVFGAFTFDTTTVDPFREIDFEDARFGNPADPTTSQVVVQPFDTPGNLERYTLPDLSLDSKLTRFFTWSPGKVEFTTLKGHHSPLHFSPADVIHQYTVLEDGVTQFVPTPDRENFRLNLWVSGADGHINGPLGGQPVEVLVNDFQFIAPAPVDDAVLFDFETGAQGWGSFGAVGTSFGELPTGGSVGQGRFHIGDYSIPDTNFGIVDVSPAGQDLSSFVGLSVDALFKDVVGQPPFVGVKDLNIAIETPSGEEFFAPVVTMTDTYQNFVVAFKDFQSGIDSLAPTFTDLSDAMIKLIVFNTNGTGTAELNYDQVIGLGSINNADFDADLEVTGSDFLAWQRGVGTGSLHSEGDANNSATVDGADLALWQSQYGVPPGAPLSGFSAVPEPASSAIFLLGILGPFMVRRK